MRVCKLIKRCNLCIDVRLASKQEFVRPRWPYDMRPSVCAEKYGCRQCVPKSTCVLL